MSQVNADARVQGVMDTMVRFAAATGRVVGDVMRDTCRNFVKDVVKLTPPFQSFSVRESFSTQRKAGEESTRRDIGRVFVGIESLHIQQSQTRVGLAVQGATRQRDAALLGELLVRSGYTKNPAEVTVQLDPRHHRAMRNKRGRVRRNPTVNFVAVRELKRYITQTLAHVGNLKAGWAAAAAKFGVPLPAWITRHSGNGTVVDNSRRLNNPEVRISNNVPYILEHNKGDRILNEALKRREQAMARQIEAKLQGKF